MSPQGPPSLLSCSPHTHPICQPPSSSWGFWDQERIVLLFFHPFWAVSVHIFAMISIRVTKVSTDEVNLSMWQYGKWHHLVANFTTNDWLLRLTSSNLRLALQLRFVQNDAPSIFWHPDSKELFVSFRVYILQLSHNYIDDHWRLIDLMKAALLVGRGGNFAIGWSDQKKIH